MSRSATGGRWSSSLDGAVRDRQVIHREPELGWMEVRTTAHIVAALRAAGLDPKFGRKLHVAEARLGVPSNEVLDREWDEAACAGVNSEVLGATRGGFTGVVCDVVGALAGPMRAWRCDIDALPIQESGDVSHRPRAEGFASVRPSLMHACGHDVHTAIALGLARELAARRNKIRGTIRLIFQPAEEGTRGAASMIAAGWADAISEFYCGHVGVRAVDRGELICGWQDVLATTKWNVWYHGRAAHSGIEPDRGIDALLVACQAVVALRALEGILPPRARVHVGVLNAGVGRNIVAPIATLQLECRAACHDDHTRVEEQITGVLMEVASSVGATCEITVVGKAPHAASDRCARQAVAAAARMCGDWATIVPAKSGYDASDDATSWMQAVQAQRGIASFVGFGTPTAGGHHTPTFDIDESVIPAAIGLLVNLFTGEGGSL